MHVDDERERERRRRVWKVLVGIPVVNLPWPFSTEERRNHSYPGKVGQRARARAGKRCCTARRDLSILSIGRGRGPGSCL